ncbi:aromatic ring-hydroxylating dioxygenase subunit alpha [Oscillatoria salina]|uniref:aromatic ring-hydroxylating dioxygenase subunit alpha n=1 Tax=Oscillatoria salina TaxID=331517 RepID=UPI0013B7E3F3|nr:aromatic ring-hydroxylating dioxygenase subunit alpha [Oscillatoria salina]MBZ8180971.1 aromatic ring-hydroxylating dioxygenase subunit alpha [Oscillatoria salina IIICB1]NET91508.1 aromatic ring-hydroxylating dioxygenase subunit alpha [Kamptonema sp. SIO1D9]
MVKDPILLDDWHVIARSQDLQPGKILSKRLLGEDIILWRNGEQVLAWKDLCPHRGVPLSLGWIEKDTVVCSYHGLVFNTEGKCVLVPATPDQPPSARACIQTYQARERYDLIWVCLGTPKNDLVPFPEWDDSSYKKIFCCGYYYNSSPLRALENFMDPAHTAFVHNQLLANSSHPKVTNYHLELHPDGVDFKFAISAIDFQSGEPNSMALIPYHFRISRPLILSLQLGTDERHFKVFCAVTPIDEEECIEWHWMLVNYDHKVSKEAFQALQDKIASQDIAIVEAQKPRRLPLNLSAEVHLPSDRYSMAYRKWLKQQGVTFGTI